MPHLRLRHTSSQTKRNGTKKMLSSSLSLSNYRARALSLSLSLSLSRFVSLIYGTHLRKQDETVLSLSHTHTYIHTLSPSPSLSLSLSLSPPSPPSPHFSLSLIYDFGTHLRKRNCTFSRSLALTLSFYLPPYYSCEGILIFLFFSIFLFVKNKKHASDSSGTSPYYSL